MGVLSITTEDVLSRVSDEVQGFFFEELEKIAAKSRAVFGAFKTLKNSKIRVPRAQQGVYSDLSSRRLFGPGSPSTEVQEYAYRASGQFDPELARMSDLGKVPPPLPRRGAGTPPPLPNEPRDPKKLLPGMVDPGGQASAGPSVVISGKAPTDPVASRTDVPSARQIQNLEMRIDKLPEREATAWKAGLIDAYGVETKRLGRNLNPDEVAAVQRKYLGASPLPAADAPASPLAKTPEARRAERERIVKGNVRYDVPEGSPGSSGEPDPDDFFASTVKAERKATTPSNVVGDPPQRPAGDPRPADSQVSAAERKATPPSDVVGDPPKRPAGDPRDALKRSRAENEAASTSSPAWLKAQREGTSNITNTEVDSFLAQQGTDFSKLEGDAKKWYQDNKGLIDTRARQAPPKPNATPTPKATSKPAAGEETFTDEQKREKAKQVGADALARQEAQEKALNTTVESLKEKGIETGDNDFMPRLKKLLQPKGKVEFGTLKSEGALMTFLDSYPENRRKEVLATIVRLNPAQALNIGEGAQKIMGINPIALRTMQTRALEDNPQMILGVGKEFADKLGIENYKALRTTATAKAVVQFGDQAVDAAGRDVAEAGARAARSGVDAARSGVGKAKDVASRAVQGARDAAARVRTAPAAAVGAAVGAAKRVATEAPKVLEQGAKLTGEAAQRVGEVAGGVGRLESNVQASYLEGLTGLDSGKQQGLDLVRRKAQRANEINDRIGSILRQGSKDGLSDPKPAVFGLSKQRATELNDELAKLRAEKQSIIAEVQDSGNVDDAITSRFKAAFTGEVPNPGARGFVNSVSGNGGIEMFGGKPFDPKKLETLKSIIGGILPPESASQEAAEAASGLGKALAEINPAYLAAAAGTVGVAGGVAMTSGGQSQTQQYGY
jgi:hypothetical protein